MGVTLDSCDEDDEEGTEDDAEYLDAKSSKVALQGLSPSSSRFLSDGLSV